MNKNKLFENLAAKENSLLNSEILAFALKNSNIQVRVDGIIMSLLCKDGQGYGIYQPTNYKEAKFVREPSFGERMEFINGLPKTRLVVCSKDRNLWYGLTSNQDVVPIYEGEDVGIQLFDQIVCAFDGCHFLCTGIDSNKSLAVAEELRKCLLTKVPKIPNRIIDVTRLDIKAYEIAFENLKDQDEENIKNYVVRGGGIYKGYREIRGSYSVTYEINGQSFTSVIDKTMRVQAAGICLNGTDKNFNLQQLMTVVREGINTHRIHRVGV